MFDSNNLKHMKTLSTHAPDAMNAFQAFEKATFADGAVDAKTKELLALAVAHTTQCPYCIDIHNNQARKAGATDVQIAETVMVAAAMRAGAAVTHGTHCFTHEQAPS